MNDLAADRDALTGRLPWSVLRDYAHEYGLDGTDFVEFMQALEEELRGDDG